MIYDSPSVIMKPLYALWCLAFSNAYLVYLYIKKKKCDHETFAEVESSHNFEGTSQQPFTQKKTW